jgi:ferredoxin-NADP reductase
MVATVTGIAPFVSMLRFTLHHGDRRFRFRVLQGASYQDEFAYRAELQAAAADHLRAECEPPRGRAQPRLDGLSAA